MLDRRALALLAGLSGVVGVTPAAAQSTQATAPLDRFDPSPAGDAFFSIPSAPVIGSLRPALALAWTYARDPLVLHTASGRGAPLHWVDHQMILHALGSFELFQRVKLDLDLPFILAQGGSSGTLAGTSVVAPSGAAVDDVRVGARVVLLQQHGGAPAAALAFSLWIPSGDATAFAGGGSARYAPALIVGADYGLFSWSTTIGRRFQSESAGQILGSQLFGGAAIAFKWQKLQIGPELTISGATGAPVSPLVRDAAGGELLLGARYPIGPVTLGVGAGAGLGQGVGTPAYRLFSALAWSSDFGAPGAAHGGSTAVAQGESGPTPQLNSQPPPPRNSKLPEPTPAAPDRDGDGVPDAEDACPTIVGDARPEAFRRGCPADRDRDGVADLDDRCPDEIGVFSDDAAKNGCPLDTDADGIVDTKDACPGEKGKPTSDPRTNGCPEAVRVEGAQIVILQQVNFETGRDEIKKDSFGLLEQVASVLAQHPEIARLAVDGHTDNRGDEKSNLTLSQRRALSVVRWLTEHGVDARRLEARGFGPRRPLVPNVTDEGRARNRRVEFLIKKRTDLGEAGWRDGPVD